MAGLLLEHTLLSCSSFLYLKYSAIGLFCGFLPNLDGSLGMLMSAAELGDEHAEDPDGGNVGAGDNTGAPGSKID